MKVQKKYELLRYQNERDEAKRLQSSRNSGRVRKGMDLQHPYLSESCRSSTVDHDEDMILESPRKRQELQEVMKEIEWKEAIGREEEAWRVEPEGETGMPETRVVADGVGGIVDLNGKGHQERGQLKNHRSQSGVPGEEGEDVESPKRKVIRVESEETQDCVREAKSKDQEEAEELSFVPSAISVPQKLMFRCDSQCSGKTLSFWQLASVVIKEGDESNTTNLCQKCYNETKH